MGNTLYTDWYNEVLPEVPGVLEALALNAIKQAAIDFCARTYIWRVDQGPIAVGPYVNTYDWEPPAGTSPVRPMQVWFDERPLKPATAEQLSSLFGDFMQEEGSPEYFVQDRPDQLIVVPMPVSVPSGGITAKLAVRPTQSATGMEAVYAERYRDAIANGAKARLLRMPKKPWTDAVMAGYYQGLFDEALGKAKVEATKGFAGARMRVTPQFF